MDAQHVGAVPGPSTEVPARLLPTAADVEHFDTFGWWVSAPILTDAALLSASIGAQRVYAGAWDTPAARRAYPRRVAAGRR